jgi:hexosaminidase
MLLSLLLLSLLCSISTKLNAESSITTTINVWPKPRNLTWTPPHQTTLLSPTFTIITATTSHQNNHLTAAISRYTNLIKTEHHRPLIPPSLNLSNNLPPLQLLTVTVTDPNAELTHGTDESYTLTVTTPNATLTAVTAFGVIRGLETFSQIAWGNPTRVAVDVRVNDAPLYGYRGVMLDTSRNYYPVKDLLRTIEAMSMNKLNVFHWHITDSHSFPLVVPSEPLLAEKGAYDVNMVYTVDDVKKVVEFGLDRGVRVLPEIDSPG